MTSGFKQLKTAGPDAAQSALQTGALQGVATGEKQIAQFDTAAGVPNTAGKIPTGATVSAVVWMRTTANLGTMFPTIKVRLDSSTGTSLCTATGTTALTTTLTEYALSCTTMANITMTASNRLYVWAGVNLTVGSGSGAFRGELGLEGMSNGAADSRVEVPTALPAPSISSASPNAGPVGQIVTITGNNFRDQQLSGVVKFFNNRTASVTSWSNTSIVATVPASSTSGNITVTVAGTASAGAAFSVGVVPSITQLSPNVGQPSTPVTITGTNFGATKGSSTVKFNGLTAATTGWSATSIAATAPSGATSGNVVVTVGAVPSNGVTFSVPTLLSILIGPDGSSIPVGATRQFTATASYSDSSTANVTTTAAWTSSAEVAATIDATGRATGLIQGETTIQAAVGSVSDSAALSVTPSRFVVTGNMNFARAFDVTALPLNSGKVLLVGGIDDGGPLNRNEVYDPAVGEFSNTGNFISARESYTATLLNNGMVLVVGGWSRVSVNYLSSAELYDPSTGSFTATGSLNIGRGNHNATLLNNGRVLIAGGDNFGFQPKRGDL